MKSVAIYFSEPKFNDRPFDNPLHKQGYEEFASVITDKGGKCFIVRGQGSFVGKSTFTHSWEWADGSYEERKLPVKVDIVWNKGEAFQSDEYTKVINDPEMDAVCRDKMATYEKFTDLIPKTLLLESADDARNRIATLAGEYAVMKPCTGWGGDGVRVVLKSKIIECIPSYPYLAQEFMDTSKGISQITSGTHDLRMIVIDGEVAFSAIRTPPHDSLIANVAQGGTLTAIAVGDLPDEATTIAKKVDEAFSSFGSRVYSVDCGRRVDGTWKIFEINPQPGIVSTGKAGLHAARYFELLANCLLA